MCSPSPDKRFRNAAITTLKKWVPDMPELSNTIRGFAISILERLGAPEASGIKNEEGATEQPGEGDGEADMATDATPPAPEPRGLHAEVRDARVVGRLDAPTTIDGVTQHVELLLALCVKDTSLLRPCVSVLDVGF